MTTTPEFSNPDSPQEPDAPREDTATSYPEGERLDPETNEPARVDPDSERYASRPEHNRDGSRAENA